jgi:hypothetical protein
MKFEPSAETKTDSVNFTGDYSCTGVDLLFIIAIKNILKIQTAKLNT